LTIANAPAHARDGNRLDQSALRRPTEFAESAIPSTKTRLAAASRFAGADRLVCSINAKIAQADGLSIPALDLTHLGFPLAADPAFYASLPVLVDVDAVRLPT
jgi:hypothetical protein